MKNYTILLILSTVVLSASQSIQGMNEERVENIINKVTDIIREENSKKKKSNLLIF